MGVPAPEAAPSTNPWLVRLRRLRRRSLPKNAFFSQIHIFGAQASSSALRLDLRGVAAGSMSTCGAHAQHGVVVWSDFPLASFPAFCLEGLSAAALFDGMGWLAWLPHIHTFRDGVLHFGKPKRSLASSSNFVMLFYTAPTGVPPTAFRATMARISRSRAPSGTVSPISVTACRSWNWFSLATWAFEYFGGILTATHLTRAKTSKPAAASKTCLIHIVWYRVSTHL